MIKLKERYDNDWRLFDTVTGEYVKNTPENRREALFCELIMNEIEFARSGASREAVYTVAELADKFKYVLVYNSGIKDLTKEDVYSYLNMLENHFACEDLLKNENFVKLSLCVLKDQQDKKTMAYYSDIDKLENKYQHFDEEIMSNVELNEEL